MKIMYRDESVGIRPTAAPGLYEIRSGKEWYYDGVRYCADDAFFRWENGDCVCWIQGKLHRANGPAVTHTDGSEAWWLNGKRHCAVGPAVTHADGSQEWWLDGKRHCVVGPAVTHVNGSQEWWLDGKRHCVVGPAVTYANGFQAWLHGGELHRLDGPALTRTSGRTEWWVRGRRVDVVAFDQMLLSQSIRRSRWTKWTDAEKQTVLLVIGLYLK